MNSALKPVLSSSGPQNPSVPAQMNNKPLHSQTPTPATYGQPSTGHMPQNLVNLPHTNTNVAHNANQNHYSLNASNTPQHYNQMPPVSNHPVANSGGQAASAPAQGQVYNPAKAYTGAYQPNLGHPPNQHALPPVSQALPASNAAPSSTAANLEPAAANDNKPQANGTETAKKPDTGNHLSPIKDKPAAVVVASTPPSNASSVPTSAPAAATTAPVSNQVQAPAVSATPTVAIAATAPSAAAPAPTATSPEKKEVKKPEKPSEPPKAVPATATSAPNVTPSTANSNSTPSSPTKASSASTTTANSTSTNSQKDEKKEEKEKEKEPPVVADSTTTTSENKKDKSDESPTSTVPAEAAKSQESPSKATPAVVTSPTKAETPSTPVKTAPTASPRTPARKSKTPKSDTDSSPPKASTSKSAEGKLSALQKSPSTSTGSGGKAKRQRTRTQPYQSPLPELEIISKISSSTPRSKANDDKLIVFYKNEFLAVRNSEGSFYVCQAVQNIYKTSSKIKIRWLSQDKIDKSGEIYTPDFYDLTDFDCILTNLNLSRVDKGKYRLPPDEKERTDSILKRSLAVEKGEEVESPSLTEEHPDGLDLSLYTEESQLNKRKGKKRKGSPSRSSSKRAKTVKSADTTPKSKKSPKKVKKSSAATKRAIATAFTSVDTKKATSSRAGRALKRRGADTKASSPVLDQKKAKVLAKVARKAAPPAKQPPTKSGKISKAPVKAATKAATTSKPATRKTKRSKK